MPYSKYKIEYTEYGRLTIERCAQYLADEVGADGSVQAARHFVREIMEACERLAMSAESYALLENSQLREKGLRKIHFRKMRYKMIYHVIESTVFIDAIFHDLQDYEGILVSG